MQIEPIQVTLVEDDPMFLEELSVLIADAPRIETVGRYTNGRDAIKGIIAINPHVALVDLELPDISGVEVIRYVSKKDCMTECVVLTAHGDDAHLIPALKAGAVGYLIKSEASLTEIERAIQDVVNGWAPMSVGIARRILHEFKETTRHAKQPNAQGLSPREIEVLEHCAKGLTTRKVAETLHIAYETVRYHQKTIYKKLHVHSLLEAVAVFKGENF